MILTFYFHKKMFTFEILSRLTADYNSGNPGTRRLWYYFIMIIITKHKESIKIRKNTWNQLILRLKEADLIKLSIFIIPQSILFIYTPTMCISSQIWILFGIHTKTPGVSELISANTSCRSSPLPWRCHPLILYITEILKYNNIKLY